jgi:acetyl-CoA acetyltransferase
MDRVSVWGGKTAIVGAADLASPTGRLDMSSRAAELSVIRSALDDAGLSLADVDGVATSSWYQTGALDLAEYLRIRPRWIDSTFSGGSAPEVQLEHAVMAVATGACNVALVTFANTPSTMMKRGGVDPNRHIPAELIGEQGEWEKPYGIGLPAVPYGLAAQRHMHLYGTTREQMAEVAMATRAWATMNPNARYQQPLTLAEFLDAPAVATPLHRFDCCLVTDGAGAVVVTTTERARDLEAKPVYVLGTGTSMSHGMTVSQQQELTVTPGAVSGRLAFQRAGLSPSDVDVLETYDSFTITVLLALEDLGFCEKGEAGSFVTGGRLSPGGSLPTNTSGGGLSYTHPGLFGVFLLVEAVRQLRGEAGSRQVPDARVALAHGCGGFLSCTGTALLGNRA